MLKKLKRSYYNVPVYIYLAFLICSLLFVAFPEIDIFISSLFFDGGFYLKGSFFEQIFYNSVPVVITILAVASFSVFLYNKFFRQNLFALDAKRVLYIILVLALAPGLIVNATLKENWGRARPAQVKEFGGEKTFTPAFILSDQDGRSFSSGHGSAAFSVLGFALLARKRQRVWITLALGYGVAVSFARIIGGGHFFSDNVTSFFVVYITTHILYYFLVEQKS